MRKSNTRERWTVTIERAPETIANEGRMICTQDHAYRDTINTGDVAVLKAAKFEQQARNVADKHTSLM